MRPLQDVSHTILSPIESLLRTVVQPVASIVSRYGDVRDLTQENEALRSENERLNADVARLREASARHEELERLLDTRNALANHEFVVASVIARDPSNLRQRIAIDRGRSDGLEEGMPVVTEGETLVGTVTHVEANHAWITLITDIDSAVSAHVSESRATGMVEGRHDGTMRMEFVDQSAAINPGNTIVTSSIGGGYPAGLVIGRVTQVTATPQELFQSVTVAPLASLSRLETVLVMVSFVPARITGP